MHDMSPSFMMAHEVKLVDGVLVCDCGLPNRYGCPCRHLFSLEPEYDLVDIAPRWHTAFAYYAYQPGYENLTKLYDEKRSTMTFGIIPKMFDVTPSSEAYPIALPGCFHKVDHVLKVYKSPVPLCYNYNVDEYPAAFRPHFKTTRQGGMEYSTDLHHAVDPFDNQNDVGDMIEGGNFTQESVPVRDDDSDLSEVSTLSPTNNSFARTVPQLRKSNKAVPLTVRGKITKAKLLNQFKMLLNKFQTDTDLNELHDMLCKIDSEKTLKILETSQAPGIVAMRSDPSYVSYCLPLDRDKESVQTSTRQAWKRVQSDKTGRSSVKGKKKKAKHYAV